MRIFFEVVGVISTSLALYYIAGGLYMRWEENLVGGLRKSVTTAMNNSDHNQAERIKLEDRVREMENRWIDLRNLSNDISVALRGTDRKTNEHADYFVSIGTRLSNLEAKRKTK